MFIEYCRFTGNWAENYGGAIYANLLGHIKSSYFESNHAKEGGAVYVNNKCTITLEKSYFKSNYCNERGGAIYTDSKSTSMYINNNAFLSNKAGTEGHDVFNSGEYKSINHNWWGTNNPSFDNKLKEYHTVGKNTDHSDSNPLKMTLTGEATGYASLPVDLQVKFSDAVPSYVFDNMTVASNKEGEFEGKLISDNQVKFSYIPEDGGAQTVSAKIDSQNVTYDIIVQKSSVYGKDLVKTYGDYKFFSAIFRNANGTFLVEGSQVTFQVNGETYVKEIIGEGQALLEDVINFLPGVYSIKSINKVTNEFFTNQLTVLPKSTTFNINDLFILKLNDGTNRTINNQTVTFKIGDKTFISNITESNAIMRLNVTPGNYRMDAIYNNKGTLVVYISNFTNNKGYSGNSLVDIYNNEASAQIIATGAYPKVVDHFPMAAWKQELIETAILAGTTIITAGVSWGITAAGVACAHAINMLVGTATGAIGGLINGFVYSVDHQDYSTFTKRLMDGINDGISAVNIGEKLSTLFGAGFIPFEDMVLHMLTKSAALVMIDHFIGENFKLIEQWIVAAQNHKLDNLVWHSYIKSLQHN
ncbi:hypothetical protein [Methanobrevibacter sp.]|uniref:hypothetical protein n=1 Tax=Methanobrevibacter sp. TaxID=66852 RepID=UPI00388E8ACB